MIDSPTPVRDAGVAIWARGVTGPPSPNVKRIALMPRIATTLITVARFCTDALPRVPRTLITIMMRISVPAMIFFCIGLMSAN